MLYKATLKEPSPTVNAAFQYINENNPENTELLSKLHLARSSFAFDLGEYQHAYSECIKAQTFNPNDLGVQETLAKLYFQYYDKFIGDHTDPTSTTNTQRNAYNLAEELMNQAIITHPDDDGLRRTRARTRIAKEQYDDAYIDIEKAIEIDGQYLTSYLIKAQIKYERQEYNEVIANCERILQNHLIIPDDIERQRVLAETYCLYAKALKSVNRLQEAKEATQKGLHICTDQTGYPYIELNELFGDLDDQISISEQRTVTDECFTRHMQSCWECLITGAKAVISGFSEPTVAKKESCWNKVFCCFGKTADVAAIALPPVALISIILSTINDNVQNHGRNRTKETCENIVSWFANTPADSDNFFKNELINENILTQHSDQVRQILENTALNMETKDRTIRTICNDILKDIIVEKTSFKLSAQQPSVRH